MYYSFMAVVNNMDKYNEGMMMIKQIIAVSSITLLSASLIGCGFNNVGETGANVVNTGVGFVSTAGTAVGTTVGKGVGFLTGHTATNSDVRTYKRNGVVYRDGHSYKIQNGKYVLVR